MIRINLLETAKGKNKRAGGSSGPTLPAIEMGVMGSPRLKLLIVLVLTGLLNFGYWYRLDRQEQSIAKQMQAALQKNRELSDVKARYLERQTQANNYKRRVDVIDSLRNAQSGGPVNLLAMLQKTGFFKSVEIKETYQDEQIKDMQAFQFMLTCEKGKS